jgi:hypothetical protein
MRQGKKSSSSSSPWILFLLIFLCGIFIGISFHSQYLYRSSFPASPVENDSLSSSGSSALQIQTQTCSEALSFAAGNRSASSKRLKTRKEIPAYLNLLGLLGEGAEIGVKDAVFSKWVLSQWKGKRYHLVDPWAEQDSKVYQDIANVLSSLSPPLSSPLTSLCTGR